MGNARANIAKPLKQDKSVPSSIVASNEGDNRSIALALRRGVACHGVNTHSGRGKWVRLGNQGDRGGERVREMPPMQVQKFGLLALFWGQEACHEPRRPHTHAEKDSNEAEGPHNPAAGRWLTSTGPTHRIVCAC